MNNDAEVTRGLQSQLDWYEGWVNEVAALLPERYDDDAAQESIILTAVADLVDRDIESAGEIERWAESSANWQQLHNQEHDRADAAEADYDRLARILSMIGDRHHEAMTAAIARADRAEVDRDALEREVGRLHAARDAATTESAHEIVRFYFSDADPVAECGCGWRAVGDSAVDAFKAWWRHSMAATEDEVPA